MPRLLAALVLLTVCANAQTDTPPAAAPAAMDPVPLSISGETSPAAELSVRDAVILGLVEGVTEFLPISSTGHLIIATHSLKLESTTPLLDSKGGPLWYKAPSEKHPSGIPLTPKLAADTYIVVIQVGAIAAVALLYWGQIVGILRGLLGRNASGIRLLRNIFLAFFPVAVAGLLLNAWIDAHLFSIGAVVAALVSGAVLMFAAERWRQQPGNTSSRKEPADLTAMEALGIGLMQCLALWPGTSRSMVTMVGGYFCGLTPARAAEFSFLVGLPTLAGAAVYKGAKAGPAMIAVFGWPHVILGTAVAAVSAALAVRFLVHYLTRHGLGLFALYRLLLAGTLAWIFLR
ncbi:MAG: undecaprenyl-diphosphate phosphatase [Opitutaceae bacterium]|nr:undecaprenyl-diphosphate phosphatase [Opitutaceae bacterium]